MLSDAQSDAIDAGLRLMRAGAFFPAHELFEAAWRDAASESQRRTLLHALAQLSAAHYQLSLGRARAALSTSRKACVKLASIGALAPGFEHELGTFYLRLGISDTGDRFVAVTILPPRPTWPCPNYLTSTRSTL